MRREMTRPFCAGVSPGFWPQRQGRGKERCRERGGCGGKRRWSTSAEAKNRYGDETAFQDLFRLGNLPNSFPRRHGHPVSVSERFCPLGFQDCRPLALPRREDRVNPPNRVSRERKMSTGFFVSGAFSLFLLCACCLLQRLPVCSASSTVRSLSSGDRWRHDLFPLSSFSTALRSFHSHPNDIFLVSRASPEGWYARPFICKLPLCFLESGTSYPGKAPSRRRFKFSTPAMTLDPSCPRLAFPSPRSPPSRALSSSFPLFDAGPRFPVRSCSTAQNAFGSLCPLRNVAFLSSSSAVLRLTRAGRSGAPRKRHGSHAFLLSRHPPLSKECRSESGEAADSLTRLATTSLFARALYPGMDFDDEEEEGNAEGEGDRQAKRREEDAGEEGEVTVEAAIWGKDEGGCTQAPRTQESDSFSSASARTRTQQRETASNLPFHRYLSARLEASRYVDQVLRLVSRHRTRMDDVHGAIALRSLARILAAKEAEETRKKTTPRRPASWRRSRRTAVSDEGSTGEYPGRETGTETEGDSTSAWAQLVTNEVFLRLLQDLALTVQLRGFSRTVDLAFVPWALARLRLHLLPSLQPLLLQIFRAVDIHTDEPSAAPAGESGAFSNVDPDGRRQAAVSPHSSPAALASRRAAGAAAEAPCATDQAARHLRRKGTPEGSGKRRRPTRHGSSLGQLKPAGLTTLAWSTSKCKYTNPTFWKEKVVPLLRDRAALFSAKELSICLYALANVGLRPKGNLSLSLSGEEAETSTASDGAGPLEAPGAFSALFRFSDSWGEARDAALRAREAKRSTLGERFSLQGERKDERVSSVGDAEALRPRSGRGLTRGGDRDAVSEAVQALGRACVDKLQDMAGQSLSSVAWAFAKWRLPHAPLFEGIGSEIRRRAHTFDAQTATVLLYAFLRLGYMDETVLAALTDVLTKRIGTFRRENFALCAWAVTKVPRHSTVKRLGDVLFPALEEESLEGYRRQDLVLILWSATRVQGSRAVDLARRVFSELRRTKDTKAFRAVDVAMLLHASSITGVTDVDLLEHHLRLVPVLLARGQCSLAELVWITASLAHLGAADATFLTDAAAHLEKRKSWDEASLGHLASFLFFSVHLAPTLHRSSPAIRRLLELARAALFSPAGVASSALSPSSPLSPSSAALSPSSEPFPTSPSAASLQPPSAPLPIFQLAQQPQRTAVLAETHSASARASADPAGALRSLASPAPALVGDVRFAAAPPRVSVKPSAFVNGVGALVRSGMVSGRDDAVVATLLRFIDAHAEDLDGVDWAKLHDAGEKLGLGRREQWRRILAELPVKLQRRAMRGEAGGPPRETLSFAAEATKPEQDADRDGAFEIVDEETLEQFAQEHVDDSDDDWGDIEVDLGAPKTVRRLVSGIPEGVDPADVISEDELYALLSSKTSRASVDTARHAFDYRKPDSLVGTPPTK
uniref:Transmembrane protein n=1 Tax=Neospora caninum (strain Liverpool) TaxID=572307 RepID=A0A0F7URD5_NEOCL|nr:TPA: hypothetical protein BN1204_063650 [Neospora caninum Liverpool]